jgi:hypothetical protein
MYEQQYPVFGTIDSVSELECQSSERPLVMEFLPDNGAPLVAPLSGGLPFGSELSLEGSVPPGSQA